MGNKVKCVTEGGEEATDGKPIAGYEGEIDVLLAGGRFA